MVGWCPLNFWVHLIHSCIFLVGSGVVRCLGFCGYGYSFGNFIVDVGICMCYGSCDYVKVRVVIFIYCMWVCFYL